MRPPSYTTTRICKHCRHFACDPQDDTLYCLFGDTPHRYNNSTGDPDYCEKRWIESTGTCDEFEHKKVKK